MDVVLRRATSKAARAAARSTRGNDKAANGHGHNNTAAGMRRPFTDVVPRARSQPLRQCIGGTLAGLS